MKVLKMMCVLIAFFLLDAGFANAEEHVYEEVLYQDVTGDKLKDRVIISGAFSEEDPQLLTHVQVRIFVKSSKDYMEFNLTEGAKPKVAFTDLNQDGIKDILVTMHPIGEGKDVIKGYGLSVRNKKLVDLEVPDPVAVESSFNNGYTATIKLGQRSVVVDLKGRKEQYEELGLYHEGQLNEPMELLIGPYTSLKPVYTVRGKGIEGIQKVSGAFEDDLIGEIKSVWIMKSDGWKLEKANFQKNVK